VPAGPPRAAAGVHAPVRDMKWCLSTPRLRAEPRQSARAARARARVTCSAGARPRAPGRVQPRCCAG